MKKNYLKKANKNLPPVNHTSIIVDKEAVLEKGSEYVIDLGNHYVGYFCFNLSFVDEYIDAPVKLYVKFCETEGEISADFDTYKEGLCSSWLQHEIINLDYPQSYKMSRRYAVRYIYIKALATPKKFRLSDFCFDAVTSADTDALKPLQRCGKELEKIDKVSVNTLKNCMQRVFEDGPKRDRRLWIGDLRLEALTNYYTFNNLKIVKRCLYLFANAKQNEYGFIPGYVYENPDFVSGYWHLMDYALLFIQSACDYYNHTGDKKVFLDLYPVIKQQADAVYNTLDDDGIVTIPDGCDVFIDWCEGLEKITAMHGVYLYVLKNLANVLKAIKHKDAHLYKNRYADAKKSAHKMLYNSEQNNFVNGFDKMQYSVHSAVWMILGGVIEGDNAKKQLKCVLESENSIKPFTPYMHHYAVEAMVELGMLDFAQQYIKSYWGAMVKTGADTFFEAFVPENPDFSPYGDKMINSMCHAWSCTPSYFIRKYFDKGVN